MFEIYKISPDQVIVFSMILLRISAYIVTMPLIGGENIPARTKIFLSLTLAAIVFPLIKMNTEMAALLEHNLILVSMKEILIGIILGFISRIFFFAITVAGELVSISIGLSSEQLLNPSVGGRATAIQQFQILIGSLLFLSINGHYYLIGGIVTSFEVLPLSIEKLNVISPQAISIVCEEIVWAGLRMAAPVMAAVFFMNVVMGILGRAVPQINVLVTSLPVNTMVGFGIIILCVPMWLASMDYLSQETMSTLFRFMKAL